MIIKHNKFGGSPANSYLCKRNEISVNNDKKK